MAQPTLVTSAPAVAALAPTNPSMMKTAMPKPIMVKSLTPSIARTANDHADVPIFLRKTYHMIDTCDPSIACWSDDGETFVIKDPVKFERTIIPQFFKHSKFSSFVRQLNFYSFRKIKYADTIRIDPKLEAQTANYWRFRHERFRRGHPEWLTEIKRMNGQKNKTTTGNGSSNGSGAGGKASAQEIQLQSEVTTLKKKMEEMTKNIDQLTSMVQQVSIQHKDEPADPLPHKKSRVEPSVPDAVSSSLPVPLPALASTSTTANSTARVIGTPSAPISMPLAMDVDQDVLSPPSMPSPVHSSTWQRETSTSAETELSDEGFVDQLFTAFKTEEYDFVNEIDVDAPDAFDASTPPSNSVIVQAAPAPPQAETSTSSLSSLSSGSNNRPRPELMERLSEALSMLPPDIQELIVDRLIQSITGPKEVQQSMTASQTLNVVAASNNNNVQKKISMPSQPVASRRLPPSRSNSRTMEDSNKEPTSMPMSLAAATLAALLAQYGNSPAVAAAAVAAAANKSGMDATGAGGKANKAHKAMPVISVHA
eukprot:CAMPEP_0119572936 /NCGR_PEP_ID=MMETSP1352-20130426/44866_1 /TAXON_ID=265584 /ORGANISM="Stauroneis constricta, Strain CCMP1120" /LENGTH=537 /DNA_ID=CAMNT_0007622623 /DNA_START=972 /DNA_END=2585 /DNA_ORIENTATION=-